MPLTQAEISDPPRRTSRLKNMAFRAFQFVVLAYVATCALLMLFETRLVYPAPQDPFGDWGEIDPRIEEIRFAAEDGARLLGWYLDHPRPRGTILYFHGNGENISHLRD